MKLTRLVKRKHAAMFQVVERFAARQMCLSRCHGHGWRMRQCIIHICNWRPKNLEGWILQRAFRYYLIWCHPASKSRLKPPLTTIYSTFIRPREELHSTLKVSHKRFDSDPDWFHPFFRPQAIPSYTSIHNDFRALASLRSAAIRPWGATRHDWVIERPARVLGEYQIFGHICTWWSTHV